MARPFTFPAEGSANAVPRSKPNKNAAFCTSNAPATPAIDAVAAEISSLQRAPDAARRAALALGSALCAARAQALWCAADPGSILFNREWVPALRRTASALRRIRDTRFRPALPAGLARVTRKPFRTLRN